MPLKSTATRRVDPLDAFDYRALFATPVLERIDLIKRGVPAAAVGNAARELDIPAERLMRFLGLAPATIHRKTKANEGLAPDEGGRVLGVARLIGQVAQMIDESGRPEGFDAGTWLGLWIQRPVPALGNRTPASLLDTTDGQQLVASVIARMQSGAYT